MGEFTARLCDRRHMGGLFVKKRDAPEGWSGLKPPCYLAEMTRVEDIEAAVAELPAEELERFREWFERFDAARFDEKIERDIASGRLDKLADQAVREHVRGRSRPLSGLLGVIRETAGSRPRSCG